MWLCNTCFVLGFVTSQSEYSCYLSTILLFWKFFSSQSKLLWHPSGTWKATAYPFHHCGHSSKGDVTDKIKSTLSSAQHLSSWQSPTRDLCWLRHCWIIWVVLWAGVTPCWIFLADFSPVMSTHLLKTGRFASVLVAWQVAVPCHPSQWAGGRLGVALGWFLSVAVKSPQQEQTH